jgi:3-ketosteroid 9alpha-monooxygenase subunit A
MDSRVPRPAPYVGWYQVAFTRELKGDVSPAQIGSLPLVMVKTSAGLRAFDATCPHRGAHLGYGGELAGNTLVCPFHGHRVHLGLGARGRFAVREYPTLEIGGLAFVLLSAHHENGLTEYLRRIERSYSFTPGFLLSATVPPDYVIENAFDAAHFQAVHGITRRPALRFGESKHGELRVESVFRTNRPSLWRQAALDNPTNPSRAPGVPLRFVARAFSPTLVATELADCTDSHVVITAATPTQGGTTQIRVSAAIGPGERTADEQLEIARRLLRDSQTAFAQDLAVWNHLIPGAAQRYAPGDTAVLRYRAFCERFVEQQAPG